MKYVILVALLAVVCYYGYLFVPAFFKAEGTLKERAIAAGKGSMTNFVAKLTSFVMGLFGSVMSYLAVADVGNLKTLVLQYVQAEYVAGAVVVLMFVVQLARNRRK